MTFHRPDRDPARPVYVISVAASIVSVHPRTLRIYEEEGFICPARTPTNIRLYSENDVRRVMWIRHLTQNLGVNLAGVKVLFELEERLGTRILERLYTEASDEQDRTDLATASPASADPAQEAASSQALSSAPTAAPAASREPTPA
ncbi:MAG TPA: MerR family transcriptional regulator [Candidatus Limnocylindrales bacterium]|nr:MerR family transcriptional regulator [Candidatus Limnocylindrales bacterium]